MKKFILSLLAIAALLIHSVTLNAQGKEDKKDPAKAMVTQFMKQLEKAELKDEETTKIREMFTKVATDVSTKRNASGITAEMLKKLAACQVASSSSKRDQRKSW